MRHIAIAIAAASCLLATAPLPAAQAADLVTASPADAAADAQVALRDALSAYLNLLMVRATFDVVERGDLEALLRDELRSWGGRAPSAEARAELDRQLLAEASYYLTSLSYTVQVGGAVFPGDKAELVYANDTIAELADLQRELALELAAGGDVTPILARTEEIHALTEGHADLPEAFGLFTDHASILESVIAAAARGTRT